MQVFREAFRKRDSKRASDMRDEEGNRVVSGRRTKARRAVSEQNLRRELSEDLASLLNTVNLESSIDLEDYSHVRRSVLNYGINDLSSLSVDEDSADVIGTGLKAALSSFEPRLVQKSLDIQREGRYVSLNELKIRFNIHADMHATPVDVPVNFVAELEVDSAKMKISKL
jgi:type VI secretion system protein ImpF